MKIMHSGLLLSASFLLAGCDIELSQEAKSTIEKTTQSASALRQEADASVSELKNTFDSELQKTKENTINKAQETMNSSLSEETHKHIDSVKQKADELGNMKVSELLSFGSERKQDNEAEENN